MYFVIICTVCEISKDCFVVIKCCYFLLFLLEPVLQLFAMAAHARASSEARAAAAEDGAAVAPGATLDG